MINITDIPNYTLDIEIISYKIKNKSLTIIYNEIIDIFGRKTKRNESLTTYCDLEYIDNTVLENILKEHYA